MALPEPPPNIPRIVKVKDPATGHYVMMVRMPTHLAAKWPDKPWGTSINDIGLAKKDSDLYPGYTFVDVEAMKGSPDLNWIFQKLPGPYSVTEKYSDELERIIITKQREIAKGSGISSVVPGRTVEIFPIENSGKDYEITTELAGWTNGGLTPPAYPLALTTIPGTANYNFPNLLKSVGINFAWALADSESAAAAYQEDYYFAHDLQPAADGPYPTRIFRYLTNNPDYFSETFPLAKFPTRYETVGIVRASWFASPKGNTATAVAKEIQIPPSIHGDIQIGHPRVAKAVGVITSKLAATPNFDSVMAAERIIIAVEPRKVAMGLYIVSVVQLVMSGVYDSSPSAVFITTDPGGVAGPTPPATYDPGTTSGSPPIVSVDDADQIFLGRNQVEEATATATPFTILTCSSTSTELTFSSATPHGLGVGQRVAVAGSSVTAYNGTWIVASAPTSTTFKVASLLNPAGATGGTGVAPNIVIAGGTLSVFFAGESFDGNPALVTVPVETDDSPLEWMAKVRDKTRLNPAVTSGWTVEAPQKQASYTTFSVPVAGTTGGGTMSIFFTAASVNSGSSVPIVVTVTAGQTVSQICTAINLAVAGTAALAGKYSVTAVPIGQYLPTDVANPRAQIWVVAATDGAHDPTLAVVKTGAAFGITAFTPMVNHVEGSGDKLRLVRRTLAAHDETVNIGIVDGSAPPTGITFAPFSQTRVIGQAREVPGLVVADALLIPSVTVNATNTVVSGATTPNCFVTLRIYEKEDTELVTLRLRYEQRVLSEATGRYTFTLDCPPPLDSNKFDVVVSRASIHATQRGAFNDLAPMVPFASIDSIRTNISGVSEPLASIAISTPAVAPQVETATMSGLVTTAGDAEVVFTSVATGVITLSAAVTTTDTTGTLIATAIRAALAAHSPITTHFTIGGSGAAITATAIVATANDTTLNIDVADATCVGITEASTSVNTTPGPGRAAHAMTVIASATGVFTAALPLAAPEGMLVTLTATDAGGTSLPLVLTARTAVPAAPTAVFSDGTGNTITVTATSGNTVQVIRNGVTLPGGTVISDGSDILTLTNPLLYGETVGVRSVLGSASSPFVLAVADGSPLTRAVSNLVYRVIDTRKIVEGTAGGYPSTVLSGENISEISGNALGTGATTVTLRRDGELVSATVPVDATSGNFKHQIAKIHAFGEIFSVTPNGVTGGVPAYLERPFFKLPAPTRFYRPTAVSAITATVRGFTPQWGNVDPVWAMAQRSTYSVQVALYNATYSESNVTIQNAQAAAAAWTHPNETGDPTLYEYALSMAGYSKAVRFIVGYPGTNRPEVDFSALDLYVRSWGNLGGVLDYSRASAFGFVPVVTSGPAIAAMTVQAYDPDTGQKSDKVLWQRNSNAVGGFTTRILTTLS